MWILRREFVSTTRRITNTVLVNLSFDRFILFMLRLPHGGPESDRKRRDIEFDRYDRENPCKSMNQIITGFASWTERYISTCSGQKNYSHQAKRMAKWADILYTGKCFKMTDSRFLDIYLPEFMLKNFT